VVFCSLCVCSEVGGVVEELAATMPPKAAKSKEPVAERPILGRFSSHLKIGIVGLPNVGKSTLFNTLTKLSIPAMNYPFCTIEPNEARVFVPDERFDWLCQVYKPKSEVIPLCCHSFHLCCAIVLQHGTVEGRRFSLPPGSLKLLSIFLLFVLWIAGWIFHGLWCRYLHFWK
jgi:hypothetical protein